MSLSNDERGWVMAALSGVGMSRAEDLYHEEAMPLTLWQPAF